MKIQPNIPPTIKITNGLSLNTSTTAIVIRMLRNATTIKHPCFLLESLLYVFIGLFLLPYLNNLFIAEYELFKPRNKTLGALRESRYNLALCKKCI